MGWVWVGVWIQVRVGFGLGFEFDLGLGRLCNGITPWVRIGVRVRRRDMARGSKKG